VSGRSFLFRWRKALLASDLPSTDKLVAFVLSMHMTGAGGSCYPSLTRIANETSLGRSTVAEALGRLEQAGWIYRERGGPNRTTRYQACLPAGSPGAGLVQEADGGSPGAGHKDANTERHRSTSLSSVEKAGDGLSKSHNPSPSSGSEGTRASAEADGRTARDQAQQQEPAGEEGELQEHQPSEGGTERRRQANGALSEIPDDRTDPAGDEPAPGGLKGKFGSSRLAFQATVSGFELTEPERKLAWWLWKRHYDRVVTSATVARLDAGRLVELLAARVEEIRLAAARAEIEDRRGEEAR
jgi:hypothetical protein